MNTSKIQPRLLKGFRDFSSHEMLQRNFVIEKIRKVVESYGFDPLETPVLEYEDILTGNIGEDEKLIYRFVDDGGRPIALRYDQTVGTCRYIAMNYAMLPMPFKRYSIQNVFRAENTQKGRYREFLQFDADIFGINDVGADIEMILLSCDIYSQLGFQDFKVYISDRSMFNEIPYTALAVIDKLDKIGRDGVIKELEVKGFNEAENLLDKVLNIQPNERVEMILNAARLAGFGEYVVFDPSIMRSFSYSTGTIWEVKIEEYRGSLLGGERFDSLVSRFSNLEVPGVGFGLGFDRTVEAMRLKGLLPEFKTNSTVLISVFSEEGMQEYLTLATKLRKENISVEIYPVYSDKLGKQFKYADKKGIPYVLTVGEDEIENGVISIKDLRANIQSKIPFEDVVKLIKGNE